MTNVPSPNILDETNGMMSHKKKDERNDVDVAATTVENRKIQNTEIKCVLTRKVFGFGELGYHQQGYVALA